MVRFPSNNDGMKPPSIRTFLFWALVWLASAGLFQKHGGLAGLGGSAALVAAAGWCWHRFGREWAIRLGDLSPGLIGGAFAIAAVAVFAAGYSWEDAKGPGRSSDRDDGLNIAVDRWVEGKSPYYPEHPMAGPLSVLPGAVLLATPFALAGNSAWQNLFWLGCFVIMSLRAGVRTGEILGLLALVFVVCPAFTYEWISGGDMLANGIYVLLAFTGYLRAWSDPSSRPLRQTVWALFLGVALASRPNFLLLLPLTGTVVWRHSGFPKACIGALIVTLVFLATTLPFYFTNPAGFTPLVAGDKLKLINQHVPWGATAVKGFCATLAVGAGFWMLKRDIDPWKWVLPLAVIVIFAPIGAMVLAQSLVAGSLDFGFLHPRYALMALFAAIWAWGINQPATWWKTSQQTVT